ncbi:MAG: hypothetical protein BWY07_02006 [Candidatus Hydrogenedentes bacterium ADurb.Bin170]|nr:MAG: hypothetical protein BWY07_02006 [Candidatus Hydrogenedentes bacterium ADurb.Bin170]
MSERRKQVMSMLYELLAVTPEEREIMRAIREVSEKNESLQIESSPIILFTVVGALQLALRHPEYPMITKAIVRDYIETVRQAMNHPVIDRLIEQGYQQEIERPPDLASDKVM